MSRRGVTAAAAAAPSLIDAAYIIVQARGSADKKVNLDREISPVHRTPGM